MSKATKTDQQAPALHIADSHDFIRVHGARENNLKDFSIEIPKRRLTVFHRGLRRSCVLRPSGQDRVFDTAR